MTEKEIKVSEEEIGWVKRLASGIPTAEVAKEAGLPAGTFAYKLNLLRERFDCANMAALIAFFYKNQIIVD